MIDKTAHVETVKTGETHKKDTVCGLYKQGHQIATRFHRVLVAARDALDGDVQIVAGGCNGCVVDDTLTGAYIYYIAQTDCVDHIAIGYRTPDNGTRIAPEDIGHDLVAAAKRLDVDVPWNGDPAKKVYLGDVTLYDD